ncbi:MAG: hypothetical protein ABH871_02760 [Pseudomonadota bacterium]
MFGIWNGSEPDTYEVVGGGAIEGAGSSIATAGGCGGGGSLTRDSFLNLHVGLNLWWILLVVGLGVGAKVVRVRSKGIASSALPPRNDTKG